MRNFQLAITFCLITIISTGCATYPKVDAALLEQNKNKTFKLGIIKIIGDPEAGFFGIPDPDVEYIKKKALNNIPISEICSILSNKYSITIDASADKTYKTVKEGVGDSALPSNKRDSFGKLRLFQTENAYYGNLVYESASTLGTVFGRAQIANNKEFPDVVNVTYSVEHGMLKESYFYDINVRSSEQDIIETRGIVASVATPGNQEAIWNSYADYAGHIGKALKRDLLEAANKSAQPSQPFHLE